MNLDNYTYIGVQEGVCQGRPSVIGASIEPKDVVACEDMDQMDDLYDLSLEQIHECFWFEFEKSEKGTEDVI